MTLDSNLSKAVYQGNGSTTVFPFAFKVWNINHIAVTVTDAAGVSTDVTSNSTVALTSSGGSVTYPKTGAPLPDGAKLAITRNMPFTQGINLTTASRFDPQVLEDGLDQATAERQQILEQMARAVILPPTSSESPEDVVQSIYVSRDAAAASASAASNKADAAALSATAAAASAADAAQSAIDAADAVPENLVTRVITLEGDAATQQVEIDTLDSGLAATNTNLLTLSRRNLIHNGDFRVDQINAGAAVTPSSDAYVVDNGKCGMSQASKITAQRVSASSNLPKCPFSERLTVASAYTVAAGDYFTFEQDVEGLNFADLLWGTDNAKPITISFQQYVSVEGIYSFAVQNATFNYSYVFTAFLTVGVNTVTATIPGCTVGSWPKDASKALMFLRDLGSGSSVRTNTTEEWISGNYIGSTGAISLVANSGAVYEFSNVQIERGSYATQFEVLPYQESLAWCQRYYEIGTHRANAYQLSGYNFGYRSRFCVQKRVAPTMTITNTFASRVNASASTDTVDTDGFMAYHAVTETGDCGFTDLFIADCRM